MGGLAVSFPALRHRDFTLLWIGQFLSFAGPRMQSAAILWHVSLLAAPGRKGIALGVVGGAQGAPITALWMLRSAAADEQGRRKEKTTSRSSTARVGAPPPRR